MKAISFFSVFMIALLNEVKTQDIHFSQYNSSPILLNPAMTSAWKDVQVTLQQKQQWKSVYAFNTYGFCAELKLMQPNWEKVSKATNVFKKKMMKGLAIGLNAYTDKAGDGSLRTNDIGFAIAYHNRLGTRNVLSAGISGAFVQRSIIGSGLRWNNQYNNGSFDPNLPSNESIGQSKAFADFGCGLLWSFQSSERYLTSNDQKNIHLGFSIMHINRPNQSLIDGEDFLNLRYTAQANASIGIGNSNLSAIPSLLYMKQNSQQELTAGLIFKYQLKAASKITGFEKGSFFSLGVYYRNKDAIIPFAGLEFGMYTLGFSYDVNISDFESATNSRGGFEICLRFSNASPYLYQNK